MIETLKQHVLSGGMINEEQARELAAIPNKEDLYEAAHQITRHFMGNKFDTCSIINAKSGNCSEDCKWCAQSGHYKTNVTLYPLLPAEECIRHATHNHKQGISRFALVTSGKKVSDKDMVKITETVRLIKQACDIKCCASMGLLSREQLQALYDSGTENYHCNIETAPSYFPHPLHDPHDAAEARNDPNGTGNRLPYLFRRDNRDGRNGRAAHRDGFVTSKGRNPLYPAESPAADTRHTIGKGTTSDGRRVPDHDRPIPLHQSECLPAFLRRTSQAK